MSMMGKFMDFFGLGDPEMEDEKGRHDEPEEEFESEPRKAPTKPNNKPGNVVSIHSKKQPQSKVVLSELRTYDEVQEVTDHLKNRRIVIVNLQRLREDTCTRVFDFLAGTVYAIGGSMSQIGHHIFICAPDSVDIQGAISNLTLESTDLNRLR